MDDYWQTENDGSIHIYDMTNNHIHNILKGFKEGKTFGCPDVYEWEEKLTVEIRRRLSIIKLIRGDKDYI